MATLSFSLKLANLFIGLCKGSRSLKPYSEHFKNLLGYEIFKFELSAKLDQRGRVHPDLIIVSSKVSNTLIIEWTEASQPDNKAEQLNRYSQITKQDIIQVMAVPYSKVKTFDVTIITHNDHSTIFTEFLDMRRLRFPLLSLSNNDSPAILRMVSNKFTEPNTDRFFRQDITIDKMPTRYLAFPLDSGSITQKTLVSLVIQHIVSLLVKRQQEIDITKFCSGYVSSWDLFSNQIQSQIKSVTKDIINELVRRPYGRELVSRISDNPVTWKLHSDAFFAKSIRSYQSSLEHFVKELEEKPFQPELPYDAA